MSSHEVNEKITPLPDARGLPFGVIDPDYARVYTLARVVAWQEGYALTLHGSFTRDLDLVAVPWSENACEPEHLVKRIEEATKLKNNGKPSERPHGRLTWTLLFPEFGDPRFVDLSVANRNAYPALVAENERLRELVREILDDYDALPPDRSLNWHEWADRARTALSTEPARRG